MDDLGGIGGLDKTGQGGGSYGGYYLPMRQKKNEQAEPPQLKQGELIIGTVIEILDTELAKVKLPMGTFNASLHNRLKAGDTLFLLVAEVSPGLVLKVHSVTTSTGGRIREQDEVVRILDLPSNSLCLDAVEFLLGIKSTILRSELIMFSSMLDKLDYENKKYSKKALFKAIFSVLIADGKEDIDLVKAIYPAFFELSDIFALLKKCLSIPSISNDEFLQFRELLTNSAEGVRLIDLSSEVSLLNKILNNSTLENKDLAILKKVFASISDFNRFASDKQQPMIWLFALPMNQEFAVCRLELLYETKTNYQPIPVSAINSFFSMVIKPILTDTASREEANPNDPDVYKKVEELLRNESAKLGFSIAYLSEYNEHNGQRIITEGILRATPRNFSIVV